MFRVLSWGGGVQSTTLAVMSALGELEPLDAVIHADTQWERIQTYEVVAFYTEWLRDHGVTVEIVTAGDIKQLGTVEHIHIPFWTSNGGPLQRQCSRHFKITPVKRRVRELMGFNASKPPHPQPGSVEQWLGFSWDEWSRMSTSRVKFITHRFPLIERKLTRWDCEAYLQNLGLPVPIKSACQGCPYRQASEWAEMKRTCPDEFKSVVKFDNQNRHNPLSEHGGSTADELYVYKHGCPLESADFDADAERERKDTQLSLLVCNDGQCWT